MLSVVSKPTMEKVLLPCVSGMSGRIASGLTSTSIPEGLRGDHELACFVEFRWRAAVKPTRQHLRQTQKLSLVLGRDVETIRSYYK